MSIRDKVIKNTFYHFIAQAFGFISPFILTPLIIKYIGTTEFGIYTIVLGFIGTFSLLDFSFSSSFIKFISEYYNKKNYDELNRTVNTGLFFYIIFSAFICIAVYFFSDYILKLINIPANLYELAKFALNISLVVFFIATSSNIFVSVLISIQKMYLNSLLGLIINFLNLTFTYIILVNGYGLKEILYIQLIAVVLSIIVNILLALKEVPELRISPDKISRAAFKAMGSFGLQMQVSRISSFLSEKYDEFLLGYFSSLNNVTFFNISSRVTRLGKFFPLQLFQQIAPVAAELNAKENTPKLNELFFEATKYLTVFSAPIFIYIFVFGEEIITTWMGPGYEISVYLLRILAAGQLINLLISAPGNSIIPNLGVPKYLMYEGIISLSVNIIVSYFMIKYYGIIGAAIGTTAATLIASSFIFTTSVTYFKEKHLKFIIKSYIQPVLIALIIIVLLYLINFWIRQYFLIQVNRTNGITVLILSATLTFVLYISLLWKTKYLNSRDRENVIKMVQLINPLKK
ncbi:MAG: polysaccharide biosynthesis protein [Ignavibacteria bacterium]|nr:polysaccharide biosynthesis protein [Ignavibacteria bacterium]